MNLENLNLVELNAQEAQEAEGGFFLEVLAGALIGYLLYKFIDAVF